MDDHEEEDQPEVGPRFILEQTRGEKLCDELRDEARDLLQGLDSLDFGTDELGLKEEHELLCRLQDARSALERIEWLLDSETFRDGISVDEDEDENA